MPGFIRILKQLILTLVTHGGHVRIMTAQMVIGSMINQHIKLLYCLMMVKQRQYSQPCILTQGYCGIRLVYKWKQYSLSQKRRMIDSYVHIFMKEEKDGKI